MNREKRVSVRFAAVGGDAVKADLRGIGDAGDKALDRVAAGSRPAEAGLDNVSTAAVKARQMLEAMAAKATATAAEMRATAQATTALQAQINRSTGVSSPTGLSSAETLAQGQALDNLRAKFNPLFGVIRSYKDQVSEIRAAHLDGAISAGEMASSIAKVRTEALGAIDKIKGISAAQRDAAKAAADAARAADEATRAQQQQAQALDSLRAKYNPLFGVISKYRAEVQSIRAAHAEGALSAEEMSRAIAKVRTESLAAIDKIKGITAANQAAAKAADEAARAQQQQAQSLSDLRAKINPLYAIISKYKAEVQSIRDAHKQGAISADEMTAAISRARQASLASIAVFKGNTEQIEQMSRASRGSTLRMQQMFYQVNDIGVSLAGGMNPFVVLAQQGTQIAQIYGFGGGGVGGIFRDLGGLIKGMPGPLKAVALAVGAGALAVMGLKNEINAAGGEVVNFGDVALAVFQVTGRNIYALIEPAVKAIAPWFQSAWDAVVASTKWAGNFLINGIRVAVAGIALAVKTIPATFSVAWNGAKVIVLDVLAGMLSGVNDLLTSVASGFNAVFRTNLSAPGGLGRVAASLTSSAAGARAARDAAMGDVAAGFDGFGDTASAIWSRDPMGEFYDDVAEQARKNARERKDKDKDKKKGRSRSPRATKEERDAVADLIKQLQLELAVLRETDPVKRRMLELSEQLTGATDEQRAVVLGLVQQLDKAEHGWEAVGRSLAQYAEDSKRLGGEIGDAFVSAADASADAFADFTTSGKLNFKDMVDSFVADISRIAFQQAIAGPAMGWLSGLDVFGGSGSSLASLIPSFLRFDGGGHTGWAPRIGGLDGKGGFMAMVHPGERITDETKGAGSRSRDGARPVQVNFYISTPDANSFRRSQGQVMADARRALGRAQRNS